MMCAKLLKTETAGGKGISRLPVTEGLLLQPDKSRSTDRTLEVGSSNITNPHSSGLRYQTCVATALLYVTCPKAFSRCRITGVIVIMGVSEKGRRRELRHFAAMAEEENRQARAKVILKKSERLDNLACSSAIDGEPKPSRRIAGPASRSI